MMLGMAFSHRQIDLFLFKTIFNCRVFSVNQFYILAVLFGCFGSNDYICALANATDSHFESPHFNLYNNCQTTLGCSLHKTEINGHLTSIKSNSTNQNKIMRHIT